MSQQILVTGARGYLGGRLVQYLARQGKTVVGSTRQVATSPDGSPSRHDPATPEGWPSNVRLVTLNPTETVSLLSAQLLGFDCIYHLSAANAADSARYPDSALFGTASGTRRLIEAAVLAGVKRFVYLSPIHVYGSPLLGTLTEESLPKPMHPYAISHLAGEHFALAASDKIAVTVVRLANGTGCPAWIYGNTWKVAGCDFAMQAIESGEIVVKDPGQWRDFISLDDVCQGLSLLADKDAGGILNLSSGTTQSLGHLATITAAAGYHVTGKPISVWGLTDDDLYGAVPPFVISNAKFRSIGLAPSGDEGLEREQEATVRFLLRRNQGFYLE